MAFVLPHTLRQAKVGLAAIAPPASASSLRSKGARLNELRAQAAWFAAQGRRQDATDLEREIERIGSES